MSTQVRQQNVRETVMHNFASGQAVTKVTKQANDKLALGAHNYACQTHTKPTKESVHEKGCWFVIPIQPESSHLFLSKNMNIFQAVRSYFKHIMTKVR